jgi:hypothetical protein
MLKKDTFVMLKRNWNRKFKLLFQDLGEHTKEKDPLEIGFASRSVKKRKLQEMKDDFSDQENTVLNEGKQEEEENQPVRSSENLKRSIQLQHTDVDEIRVRLTIGPPEETFMKLVKYYVNSKYPYAPGYKTEFINYSNKILYGGRFSLKNLKLQAFIDSELFTTQDGSGIIHHKKTRIIARDLDDIPNHLWQLQES